MSSMTEVCVVMSDGSTYCIILTTTNLKNLIIEIDVNML